MSPDRGATAGPTPSLPTLIRSWWSYCVSPERDFKVWQCMVHTHGELGECCQRLRGHFGKHRTYHGTEFVALATKGERDRG